MAIWLAQVSFEACRCGVQLLECRWRADDGNQGRHDQSPQPPQAVFHAAAPHAWHAFRMTRGESPRCALRCGPRNSDWQQARQQVREDVGFRRARVGARRRRQSAAAFQMLEPISGSWSSVARPRGSAPCTPPKDWSFGNLALYRSGPGPTDLVGGRGRRGLPQHPQGERKQHLKSWILLDVQSVRLSQLPDLG